MDKYQVIVGNVGTVYSGEDEAEAGREYTNYVQISQLNRGRCGGESVTLMADGEPTKEYTPTPRGWDEV